MSAELGIIEGYFGRSWSWTDRAMVLERLAPVGYRFFHYAPKIDAKLRDTWQILHDDNEAASLASFAMQCRALGVRFGIGLTPYGAQLEFDAIAKAAMKAKLAQFDAWGIDDLAILFDDIKGDISDLAQRQSQIAAFAFANSKATRFFFCPSYYSNDILLDRMFGKRPEHYLETLGKLLDPQVSVYWTGEEVCAPEIGCGHMRDMAQILQRKVALWDNYPVNDGMLMAPYLHLRAFTGRPANLGNEISHHAVNPASQAYLSCIPALTLPMLYQRGDAYRYSEAFIEASQAVCGLDLADRLRRDLLVLQHAGLPLMTPEIKTKFVTRYSTLKHPAADEIVDWLQGGYAVDMQLPAMV